MDENINKKPTLLCIIDGFGKREDTTGNAVKLANTPTLDELYSTCPNSQLITHGEAVGLPNGQMGNSEVGHMTIGSGRVTLQSLDKIQQDFDSGDFTKRRQWQIAARHLRPVRKIHMIGMISDGGVHSHTNHAINLAKILNDSNKQIFVHAITDGRDTAPNDAEKQLNTFLEGTADLQNVQLATISGRFFSMDRDNRKERTTIAMNAIKSGMGRQVKTMQEALEKAQSLNETDEFIRPSILPVDGEISPEDGIIFFNFRADRMRQIVKEFIDNKYNNIITMTEYDSTFNKDVITLYPPDIPQNTLGEVVEKSELHQLRIAESEKYAHVTFFFNGGREQSFENEERIVVSSPQVKTYDLQPEMSLPLLSTKLYKELNSGKHDLIVLNIANGDQVGHSGNLEAAIEAVEHIDTHLKHILTELKNVGGDALIIADHGNCEEMLKADGSPATAHTTNPVPCIYVGEKYNNMINGSLVDVAPTILTLMGLNIPPEMSGKCLLS